MLVSEHKTKLSTNSYDVFANIQISLDGFSLNLVMVAVVATPVAVNISFIIVKNLSQENLQGAQTQKLFKLRNIKTRIWHTGI